MNRTQHTTPTLAELAIEQPGAIKVFMRRGLDFCCHGQRSLTEACVEKGLDPKAVFDEIANGGEKHALAEARWSERPLPELIDFILTRYHEPLRQDLPVLIELARKVERVHGEKLSCPVGLAAHLANIRASVESHLTKEEHILFPMIRSGRGAMAYMPINIMMQEHEDHGANLRRTRELTHDLVAPPEACTTWRALYQGLLRLEAELMEHIHLENNVLFPRTVQVGHGQDATP